MHHQVNLRTGTRSSLLTLQTDIQASKWVRILNRAVQWMFWTWMNNLRPIHTAPEDADQHRQPTEYTSLLRHSKTWWNLDLQNINSSHIKRNAAVAFSELLSLFWAIWYVPIMFVYKKLSKYCFFFILNSISGVLSNHLSGKCLAWNTFKSISAWEFPTLTLAETQHNTLEL